MSFFAVFPRFMSPLFNFQIFFRILWFLRIVFFWSLSCLSFVWAWTPGCKRKLISCMEFWFLNRKLGRLKESAVKMSTHRIKATSQRPNFFSQYQHSEGCHGGWGKFECQSSLSVPLSGAAHVLWSLFLSWFQFQNSLFSLLLWFLLSTFQIYDGLIQLAKPRLNLFTWDSTMCSTWVSSFWETESPFSVFTWKQRIQTVVHLKLHTQIL